MFNNYQVLLVEDQPIARIAAQTLLKTLGCEIKSAGNGKEALDLAKSQHFDLVFMDIGLPDMDGYAVTKNIRALPSPYNEVPIVALTAHDDEETKNNVLAAGMQAYYTKPLTVDVATNLLKKFPSK